MYSESIEKVLKAAGVALGDEVRVSRSGGDTLEGVLMPRSDSQQGWHIDNQAQERLQHRNKVRFRPSRSRSSRAGRETFSFPKAKIEENRKLPKITLITPAAR